MGVRRPAHRRYMRRFAWTKIVRHTMVAGTASVDDPALANYWALRRRRPRQLPLDSYLLTSRTVSVQDAGSR